MKVYYKICEHLRSEWFKISLNFLPLILKDEFFLNNYYLHMDVINFKIMFIGKYIYLDKKGCFLARKILDDSTF